MKMKRRADRDGKVLMVLMVLGAVVVAIGACALSTSAFAQREGRRASPGVCATTTTACGAVGVADSIGPHAA
jgi:hypothetical protein